MPLPRWGEGGAGLSMGRGLRLGSLTFYPKIRTFNLTPTFKAPSMIRETLNAVNKTKGKVSRHFKQAAANHLITVSFTH